MANVYSQINIQTVFSVKGRQNFLTDKLRPELFMYKSGILKNIDLFPLAVNGFKDHVHLFFELKPNVSVSKAMEIVKTNSSKWMNDHRKMSGQFEWQRGYGCFSYSRSQRNSVIQYIMRQEEHHFVPHNTFRKEYLELLDAFEIDYDPHYLFEFYD
ncbi:MAG: IS200/IS605 family transposase [Bacteroidota bacterium]